MKASLSIFFLGLSMSLVACTNTGKNVSEPYLPSGSSQAMSTVSQSVSPNEAWKKVRAGALFIDVRSHEEYAAGHFDSAINIPHTEIRDTVARIGADKNREIVLHCKSGRRAGLAQQDLLALGYTHVYNAGGYTDLLAAKAGAQ